MGQFGYILGVNWLIFGQLWLLLKVFWLIYGHSGPIWRSKTIFRQKLYFGWKENFGKKTAKNLRAVPHLIWNSPFPWPCDSSLSFIHSFQLKISGEVGRGGIQRGLNIIFLRPPELRQLHSSTTSKNLYLEGIPLLNIHSIHFFLMPLFNFSAMKLILSLLFVAITVDLKLHLLFERQSLSQKELNGKVYKDEWSKAYVGQKLQKLL